jgi:hypothetical protein
MDSDSSTLVTFAKFTPPLGPMEIMSLPCACAAVHANTAHSSVRKILVVFMISVFEFDEMNVIPHYNDLKTLTVV